MKTSNTDQILLREVLVNTERKLRNSGITEARRESEYVLEAVLCLTRNELLLKGQTVLSHEQIKKLNDYIEKRKKRIPLQYITGEAFFYGLKFRVNEYTHIPRPETEVLVERCIQALCSLKKRGSKKVLEIGTGCGNIAVALARFSFSEITAVDIDEKALSIAALNAKYNNVEDKIRFICCDIHKFKKSGIKYDCLVSNPPYISENEYTALAPEVLCEPAKALVGGKDGVEFIEYIVNEAHRFLNPGGKVFIEIGYNQREPVAAIAKQSKTLVNYNFFKDLSGKDRIFVAEVL